MLSLVLLALVSAPTRAAAFGFVAPTLQAASAPRVTGPRLLDSLPHESRRSTVLGLAAAAASSPLTAGATLPKKFLAPPILLAQEGASLTLVISGSAGPDIYSHTISDALKEIGQPNVVDLDWRTNRAGDSWSIFSSALSAGANGRLYGSEVGREIGSMRPDAVHVIAISAGAFAGDALVVNVRRAWPSAYLRLTVLDGFTADGALSALADDADAPGLASFGVDADYAEAFINADDPVPSTTLPLRQAANFDVTGSALRARFEPLLAERGDSLHLWPAAYYGETCAALLAAEKGVRPRFGDRGVPARGSVTRVV
jgi:hypothetical protein